MLIKNQTLSNGRVLALTLLAGVCAWVALYLFPLLPSGPSASVRLAGSATPGADVILKLNDIPYARLPLSHISKEHNVQVGRQAITSIELALQGAPGTSIQLDELTISYGPKIVSERHGETLGALKANGLADLKFDSEGLKGRLTTDTADISDQPVPPLTASGPMAKAQQWLVGESRAPRVANVWAVVLLIGIVALLVHLRRRRLMALTVGVFIWLVAVASYELTPSVLNPDPPVAVAVGAASYFGTPYAGQQAAAWVTLLVILIGSVALRLYQRRQDSPDEEPSKEPEDAKQTNAEPKRSVAKSRHSSPAISVGSFSVSRAGAIVFIGWLAASLTLIPGLGAPAPDPVQPSWDVGNLTAWNLFYQMGLVPMRDYWFPYGNQWLFGLPSIGPIWMWLVNVAMLAILTWSLWRLSGRRAARVVVCLVAVTVISALGAGLWRLLPAMLIAISYAALGPARHSRLVSGHLIFFAACFLGLFVELDILALGLAGAGLVLFGELLFGRLDLRLRPLLVGVLIDAAPVFAAVLLTAVIWVAQGTFEGNASWLLHLSDASAYYAPNQATEGALSQLSLIPNTNTLVVVLPFLLLFTGLAQGFLGSQPASVGASRLLLATAGPSMLLLHRTLARPFELMIYLPLVAFACVAVMLWNRRMAVATAATGVFLGAIFAGLQRGDGLQMYLSSIGRTPLRALDSAFYLARQGETRFAKAELLARRRFQQWPELRIAKELRSVSGSARPSFWVLGDAPMLYVFMHERPLFQINLYDSARFSEQRRMITDLRRERRKYLVWRRDSYEVDAVPYKVRDPLLFSYAIGNYVPTRLGQDACPPTKTSCMAADILVRRRAGRPMPVDYWTSRLGTTIDLGFIPSYAELPGKEPCPSGASCIPYAVVKGRPQRKGQKVKLVISGRRRGYEVVFNARRGVEKYTIRLDRLWFWQLLGPHPKLAMHTPGWTLDEQESQRGDRLY